MDAETNNGYYQHYIAWLAIMDVLDEVTPGWRDNTGRSGIENAVKTIRSLAARSDNDRADD